MRQFFKEFFRGDHVLWICFFFLIAVSVVEMYSASSALAFKSDNYNTPIIRHAMMLTGGIILAFFVHRVLPYRYIPFFAYIGYLISIALLVIVLIFGESTNDAARYFSFGGINFQPSEIAKISTILTIASLLGRFNKEGETDKNLWWYILLVLLPVGFIVTENLSTAVLLTVVCFVMIICAGLSLKGVWRLISSKVFVGIALVVVFALAYGFIYKGEQMKEVFHRAETWQARITNFYADVPLDDSYEITDANRQSSHAQIAISNGKYFGMGVGNSEQRDFLSHAFDDFIFAIVVEEIGIFSMIIVVTYLIVFSRAIFLIQRCDEPILCYSLLGLSLMILVQAYFHVAVVLGCVPVTGQPLPIISRGGTSNIITSLYFGLMICISRYVIETSKETSSNGRQAVDKTETDQ